MTYYVVLWRSATIQINNALDRVSPWMPAEEKHVGHSYESYPVMYQTRERAEKHAKAWLEANQTLLGSDTNYETQVVEVTIVPPAE